MKKTLSVFLAVALAFTLGISVFAADFTLPDVNDLSEKASEFLEDNGINLGDATAIFDTLTSQISIDDLQSTIQNALASVGEAGNFDITSLDTSKVAGFMDSIMDQLKAAGVDVDSLKSALGNNELLNFFANIYTGGKITETTTAAATTEPEVIPQTGSMAGGIAVFATLSLAAAAAFVCTKKK